MKLLVVLTLLVSIDTVVVKRILPPQENPLPNPVTPIEPIDPPVVSGCQCGCGKQDCKCGKSGCQSNIDVEKIQQIYGSKAKRKVQFFYTNPTLPPPYNFICPSCEIGMATLKSTDDYDIEFLPATVAPYRFSAFPTLYFPDADTSHTGNVSQSQLNWLIKNVPPKSMSTTTPMSAVNVGTLKLDNPLKLINGNKITIQSLTITFTNQIKYSGTLSKDKFTLTFAEPKPRMQVSAINLPISTISLQGNYLNVGIDGFPDVQFTLQGD